MQKKLTEDYGYRHKRVHQDKFQSISRAKNITAQTYIFIAENDRVIPRARSERLKAQFTEQLIDSVLVSGADHNDISLYPEYIAGVKRALQSY
jgi:uncharacterized protein